MILRLWHKLFFTIIGITGLVLVLSLYISDLSVKKGFLSYINQVESNRLNDLTENLIDGYQDENDWEFIRDNRRLWQRFNQRPRTPLPSNRKDLNESLPRLIDLAKKEGKGQNRVEPFDRPRHRPPSSRSERGDRGETRERRPPPHLGRPPPTNLVLLDQNKQYVMGGRGSPLELSTAKLKVLKSNNNIIGYLQFEPFTQFTDELDKQFIQYQKTAFFKIALLALIVILIGTALLAVYLRSRIKIIGHHASLLASGDFSPQTLDKSNDELGQLSQKLDILGRTLKDTQISRRRWVSDISHELRTPVAVLQGEIEAIQDGIRAMTNESIKSLHTETLRLSRLINDLHQLSLSDIGALNYVKKPLNVVALVQTVLTKHQQQFDIKDINVNFRTSHEHLLISADEQRLEQLFSNLANNSQHYTAQSGQIEINIIKKKNNILINWEDSKPGVTNEELDQIFQRLYRVEESRNRNEGGSGLGLSISKSIVEAHDATITANHSSLGGISFTITFKTSPI